MKNVPITIYEDTPLLIQISAEASVLLTQARQHRALLRTKCVARALKDVAADVENDDLSSF